MVELDGVHNHSRDTFAEHLSLADSFRAQDMNGLERHGGPTAASLSITNDVGKRDATPVHESSGASRFSVERASEEASVHSMPVIHIPESSHTWRPSGDLHGIAAPPTSQRPASTVGSHTVPPDRRNRRRSAIEVSCRPAPSSCNLPRCALPGSLFQFF
jgi:hypothetical protein